MSASPAQLNGTSYPLGATVSRGGVNFSVFSKTSETMELLLFEHYESGTPSQRITLTAGRHRSYHYWHVFVPGIGPGQCYGYCAHGPNDPARGLRHDPEKLLLDPYGRCVAKPAAYSRVAASQPGNNFAVALKSVVADPTAYDWENDQRLNHSFTKTVIYELHVPAFTAHSNSGVTAGKRGTYAGLIEKIPYLRGLGITAVELLPVFAFDQNDAPPGKINYWGYAPISFFAPHPNYSSDHDPLGALNEFRDMVKALHQAGIEVILDVVYNHTAEGNEQGPSLCFRGLANSSYYILERDPRWYANYSGCGNTLNAHNPVCRRMILDSLRYWVSEMHVDGFRFDLASILSRDEAGVPIPNPPILWDIETDPQLANVKLIAEAWDAAGLYQVGSFIGDSWKEWNGRFRDDVRSFVKGEPGMARQLATRLCGSSDLYGHEEREPEQSINYVTCHDGFTLNDLVSYNDKHNEDNGEGNRDGCSDHRSWNCGHEGPAEDAEVESLRQRQIKNLLTITMISAGTPMLLMGDEVRRTQRGNNNAYCQNNEISWFDWDLVESQRELRRFVELLIAFRQQRVLPDSRERMTLRKLLQDISIEWHGTQLWNPDWSNESRTLAATFQLLDGRTRLHCMFNAYWELLSFELPSFPGTQTPWRRVIDTALTTPDDIRELANAPEVHETHYLMNPRSVVVLIRETADAVINSAAGEC